MRARGALTAADWNDWYAQSRNGRVVSNAEIDQFYQRVRPAARMTAADIGCGLGAWTRQIARFGVRTAGYDYSSEALVRARRSTPFSGRVGFAYWDLNADGAPLTIPPGSLDIASFRLSLEFLDRHRVMTDVKRWLRPGGLV
ncbi:class I SAM-dependent methyltransferase [Streptomyces sp. NPDC056485]|uniref:class I SAM-dependent methyltransferase n=1 Tax=Streptomyces sp. NPDC056485 TaxID=3345834 RepID=UPI00368473B5